MAPYTTVEEVLSRTGATVTDAHVTQAYDIINVVTNLTDASADSLRPADLAWLGAANGYQAAWIAAQPDVFTRNDVTGISHDGLSVNWRNDAALYLAPLAVRALQRLSWVARKTRHGGRTIPVVSDFERASRVPPGATERGYGPWIPLGGAS